MSYDLRVFAKTLPETLRTTWPLALARSGLVAEVQPDFVATEYDGYLSWKLRVASAESFRFAARYPASDFEAGFEMTVSPADVDLEEWKTAAPEVVRCVEAAEYMVAFSSPHDCSPAEFRLQWFAAATLAQLTDGAVLEPQEERSFTAQEALAEAEYQSDKFEEDQRDDWTESPAFAGW